MSLMLGTSVVESKAKAECRLTHESNRLPFPAGVYSVGRYKKDSIGKEDR